MFTKTTCPICGNESDNFSTDHENLDFLGYTGSSEEVNTAITMARIVWGNLPNSAHLRITQICKMEAHKNGRQNENPEARI